MTNAATTASPFNIRFVEPKWQRFFGWRNVPCDVIEITDVRVPEWDAEADEQRDFQGPNVPTKKSDLAGGFTVSTRKPKEWISGRPLWIEITVEARKPWVGFLSFEGRTDRRAFARRQFVVI
jgi:hypothetical protein